MDFNNKRLEQTRQNDKLIYELINSPYYEVKKTGEIFTTIDTSGNHRENKWRRVDLPLSDGYKGVSFKRKRLNVGRVIFAKHGNSALIAEKVINHLDGNKNNNSINNLELVTYSENNIHRYQILEGKIPKEKPKSTGRSGALQATLDDFIRDLLKNENYKVKKDGTVWTKITVAGNVSVDNTWRNSGFTSTGTKPYFHVKYRDKGLRRSRIIYAKFNGELSSDLVINHLDGNTLNDHPSNLELITQGDNVKHTYDVLKMKPVAGNRKINPKIANEIRELSEKGWTNKKLKEKFKLSKSTISYIVNGKIWNKEVTLSEGK